MRRIRSARPPKAAAGRPPEIASYAVQRRPSDDAAAREWEKSVIYWDRQERVRCFDVDASKFLEELVRRCAAPAGGNP